MIRRLLRLWPFLVLFGAAVFCLRQAPFDRLLAEGEGFEEILPSGEAFLHHIPRGASSFRMPMAAVVMAWHQGHAPEWAKSVLQGALWTAPVFVAFQLGCLLQSPAAGALSALVAAAPLAMNATGMGEEVIYRLLVGLSAVLLVWRSLLPGLGRSIALGLGIGVSLLCRSPLFLLPVFLAFYDLRIRRPGGRVGPSLALVGASFILLVPWALLNWRLEGLFIPFEYGRGDCNTATGALGIVASIAGNYRELAGLSENDRVLPWAVGEVLRHPIRYAGGVLGRLWFVFRLQPFLCLAAAAAWWIHRRREGYRQAGLFIAYFVGMHCLLSIEARYLEPVWILMATLAVSGGLALIPFPERPEPSRRLGWFLWPYLGAGAAASGLIIYCLWTYPTDPLAPARAPIAQALDREPDDAWLLHLDDRLLLRSGRGPSAVDGARAALLLKPDHVFLFSYVWALTTAGQATEAWMDRITTGVDPCEGNFRDKTSDGYLLKMLWRLSKGDKTGAAKAYADARGENDRRLPLLKLIESPYEREVESRLQQVDNRGFQKVRELLNAWPPPFRAVLARRTLALVDSPGLRPQWLSLLDDDGSGGGDGEPSTPMRPSRKQGFLADKTMETYRQAMVYQDLKEYGQTLRILNGLVAAYPANAKLRSDRGVAYALSGRSADAVKDLREALRIDPRFSSASLSLGIVLAGRKQYPEALTLYEEALRRDCARADAGTCDRIREERDRLVRLRR